LQKRSIKIRLLEVISMAKIDQIESLLDDLWATGRFTISRPPETGLVMSLVNDPFDVRFCFGEIMVSQAKVCCDDQPGCGVLCGDELQRVLLLAAVEAAELRGATDLLKRIDAIITPLQQAKDGQATRLSKMAAATSVQFSSMTKEAVDFGSLGEQDR
jgi:phosphonate C-P lyase system protein PhnG